MNKQWDIDKKLNIYGSKGHIEQAENILNQFLAPHINLSEGAVRLYLSKLIEEHRMNNVEILYDGNIVWNKKKILAAINTVMRCGMEKMTDYLYKFLSLSCGSIAHYNKQGWIDEYPTIQALKAFFQRNEFGERVYDYIPQWKTDAKAIVSEIEKILYLV